MLAAGCEAAAHTLLCEFAETAATNCPSCWVGDACEGRTRRLFVNGTQSEAGDIVRRTYGGQWWGYNDMAQGRLRKCLGTLFCPAQNVREHCFFI